jgi:hypothetical protein
MQGVEVTKHQDEGYSCIKLKDVVEEQSLPRLEYCRISKEEAVVQVV